MNGIVGKANQLNSSRYRRTSEWLKDRLSPEPGCVLVTKLPLKLRNPFVPEEAAREKDGLEPARSGCEQIQSRRGRMAQLTGPQC